MGFRFRRSISIVPGLRLNFGKKGVSASVGVRGAHVTIGKTGVRTTVGLPGTGLSYTEHQRVAQSRVAENSTALAVIAMIGVGAALLAIKSGNVEAFLPILGCTAVVAVIFHLAGTPARAKARTLALQAHDAEVAAAVKARAAEVEWGDRIAKLKATQTISVYWFEDGAVKGPGSYFGVLAAIDEGLMPINVQVCPVGTEEWVGVSPEILATMKEMMSRREA